MQEIEKYCRPQHLTLYNPIDSGIKYNVMGLFGIPEAINPSKPCMYTVLASVFPPADPYKPKPANSMFGANFFTEIDFEKSMLSSQFFKQEEDQDVELSGIVLKLNEHSVLLLDIKKFDL